MGGLEAFAQVKSVYNMIKIMIKSVHSRELHEKIQRKNIGIFLKRFSLDEQFKNGLMLETATALEALIMDYSMQYRECHGFNTSRICMI